MATHASWVQSSSRRLWIRLECPSGCRPFISLVELVDQRGGRQRRAVEVRLVRQIPRSLRIQSTAKPKSNLSASMVLPAVLHLPGPGGPLGDHLEHRLAVEPALLAKAIPSDSPCTSPAMQIWLTILVSCPAPAGPMRRQARGVGHDHRLGAP